MKLLPPDALGIRQLEFFALGVPCSIKFRHPDDRKAREFAGDAFAWIESFEAGFSRFRPDSMISRINAAAGVEWVPVDAEMEHVLDIAHNLYQRSDGILDPTLLPLLRVWDWQSVHFRLPKPAEIKAAHALTGWHLVKRRRGAVYLPRTGMGLDFGVFGKEYAVDQLARLACRHGVQDALIDLGRNVFALGGDGRQPYWQVGIEDGNQPGQFWADLAVSDLAVTVSGDFARYFDLDGVRFSHILDPRTGWPVDNGMRAVTVTAPSCLQAGLYSTTVYVLGAAEGLQMASLARGVEVCAQSETGFESSRGFDQYVVRAAQDPSRSWSQRLGSLAGGGLRPSNKSAAPETGTARDRWGSAGGTYSSS